MAPGAGAGAGAGGTPTLYAAATVGGKTAFWHTDDNGANWAQINGGGASGVLGVRARL